MDFDPVDRRKFLSMSGGALLCTIAGKDIVADKPVNIQKLASGVAVPPKVAAARGNPG